MNPLENRMDSVTQMSLENFCLRRMDHLCVFTVGHGQTSWSPTALESTLLEFRDCLIHLLHI